MKKILELGDQIRIQVISFEVTSVTPRARGSHRESN